MAKQKLQNNTLVIGIGAILVIGIMAVTFGLQHSTEYKQHASSSFSDLNSADDIASTNNSDGTMGAADDTSNFSNTLPLAFLGTLDFQVTDPSQGKRPDDAGNPHDQITISTTPSPTYTL